MKMKILMIGAHPDDCEFRCSGLASMYVKAGHQVRFLSMCDGSGGHMILNRAEIAARRWNETREAAKQIGIEYDVWNIPDCEIMADLRTRERLIRYIREYSPDVIFAHRTNDYHADHRNAGFLVQDASYLLIVPNYCPDSPAMKKMPVIMFMEDRFKYPPFQADVVIDIDDAVENKFRMLNQHVSQVYEWLPYTEGCLDEVPKDPEARYQWLHGDPVTKETPDEVILSGKLRGYNVRFARTAARFRQELIKKYGEERGSKVRFAEAYEVSEYGSPLNEELKKQLFPF